MRQRHHQLILTSLTAFLFFIFTNISIGQTTVTLAEQCKCSVLSGTEVLLAGVSNPMGGSVGDLYLQTDQKILYFWDGDSWEFVVLGSPIGAKSIVSTVENVDGTITFNYSDTTSFTTTSILGDPGPSGSTGVIGSQGSIGLTGPAGATGAPGSAGADGSDGSDGAAGVKGDKGDKGDAGDTAPAGPTGVTGPAGPQGPQGPIGLTGSAGATGVTGPAGSDGSDGAAGVKGDKGDTGDTGDTGPAGATGATGSAGADGSDGAAGAKGDKGDKGDTGDTGPAGPTGVIGSQGPIGLTGPAGATGVTGPAGSDGSDGSDGVAGAKGDKGDKGDAGDSFDSSGFFFYPPSVSLDVSTAGASHSYDLYALYVDNFSSPSATASGAPTSINVFDRTALNYFVTDYDTSVFENLSISSGGVLAYRVKATPTNDNTIINIVFVVK